MSINLTACAAALALLVAGSPASAIGYVSLPEVGSRPAATLVLGFCGIGYHRDANGACVRNGVIRRALAQPQPTVAQPLACPPNTYLATSGRACLPRE